MSAQTAYECLIAVALLTAQVKIAMCGNATIPGSLQYIQQRYAVCTAAEGYQHRLVFDQQTVFAYICTNSAQQ